ncbi:MAG: hypothetical protein A2374_01985 [Candidatus Moranbacteria bacterium RIFOXYB1_FULL_44_23]|nr:MAG: hypothetical protein A2194_03630 [Candidatus Moranbacteria bacterium RIFOXYA1_FULL_44_8]OGI34388.1 MAG: hypothetical protein A2407_04485 [Candidatus Moranbacteria bacterium RIFOXYC1_FULL_44_8]OGI40780.1 MAG: hypothetical protein A2374_01985 [Candidatus Moranbacteria bacterium RIFOXYB1_FULL_44_23]OGI43245.1 MAG: hypothetical protein A2593_01105 [Candidatus Moranbacteria bacterium RIFOXYD1_FULL_44_9]HBB36989.1 hypothetical protein [Candidatus Moranbacteria bacterium]
MVCFGYFLALFGKQKNTDLKTPDHDDFGSVFFHMITLHMFFLFSQKKRSVVFLTSLVLFFIFYC